MRKAETRLANAREPPDIEDCNEQSPPPAGNHAKGAQAGPRPDGQEVTHNDTQIIVPNFVDAGQAMPRIYPNNTLVEDLSKHHENLLPESVKIAKKAFQLTSFRWLRHMTRLFNNRKLYGGERDLQLEGKATQNENGKYRFPMPNSIMRLKSSLSQEDYNQALSVLTADMRYKLHLLLYRHLRMIWALLSTSICVLVPMLALPAITVVACIWSLLAWLFLVATGVPLCRRLEKQLDRMLERAVAQANSFLMDHKLMLGVINTGGLLVRSRFVVPMLFFDAASCIEQVKRMIISDLESLEAVKSDEDENQSEMNQSVLFRTQLAKKIVLSFSQRWIWQFDRSKLLLEDDIAKPRHLSTGKCLCQFVEENLRDEGDGAGCEQRRCDNGIVEAEDSQADQKWTRGEHEKETSAGAEIHIPSQLLKGGYLTSTKGEIQPVPSVLGAQELSVESLMVHSQDLTKGTAHESEQAISEVGSHSGELYRTKSEASRISEISLDLDGEGRLASRNQELFKGLELLLEQRSNELAKSLDASSVTTLRNQLGTSQSVSTIDDMELGHSNETKQFCISHSWSNTEQPGNGASLANQISKRFFSKIDRLSWFGAKPHSGFYSSSSDRVLDI